MVDKIFVQVSNHLSLLSTTSKKKEAKFMHNFLKNHHFLKCTFYRMITTPIYFCHKMQIFPLEKFGCLQQFSFSLTFSVLLM